MASNGCGTKGIARYQRLLKTLPHVAFEVDDIYEAIKGKTVIIEPNSPSEGTIVAFIEDNGAPIELIQLKKGNHTGI